MKFISTNGQAPAATFREALFSGLSPDGGLYVPETLPKFSHEFLKDLPSKSLRTIGEEVLSMFIDDLSDEQRARLAENAWNFPVPLVRLERNLFLLELFHGPTLAFKDFGARFLAQILSHYLQESQQTLTILVATSGDTGSAVAHGFYGAERIEVYVLYPSGQVSPLQERQMTTLGGNIHAVEVSGTFDDCQRMVRQALVDPEVLRARNVTTANSLNLGRLIPQVVYYVWGYAQWKPGDGQTSSRNREEPLVVVPSGNFGNLTAAVYARQMGTPLRSFLAATNRNDVVPEYLRTGTFTPRPSQRTLSNAMDVGNPSNVARLRHLFGDAVKAIRKVIDSEVVTDDETLREIRSTYERTGTILDPHTAVAVAAARRRDPSVPTIVAATAHPAKFPDVIKRAVGMEVPLPAQLRATLDRPKLSIPLPADAAAFKKELLGKQRQ